MAGVAWTDQLAYVHKLRESVNRLHPGPSGENTALRAKFGLHKIVRASQPQTLADAAKALLVGKKTLPGSRAAKLIIASDEKQLRAIVQAVPKTTADRKKVRSEAVSRTAQRDILNTALELFYDDFAATVGAILAGDEVARLHALQLVPRRPEQRTEREKTGEGAAGSGEGSAPAMSTALVKA